MTIINITSVHQSSVCANRSFFPPVDHSTTKVSSLIRTKTMSYSKLFVIASAFSVANAVVPNIEGFKLTWSDDFVGQANSLPNPSNWVVSTGTSYPGGASNWGTGEIQTYTSDPQNLKLSGNGTLQITAIKSGSSWTSARIETQRTNFLAEAGGKMRIQASLNLPDMGEACVGYWPAFWTLGADFRGNYQ